MKISLYCIGHIKENYWKEAIEEYSKRISAYAKIEIVEFPDYPTEGNEDVVKEKEASKILAKLKPNDFVIRMDLREKQMTSPSFAGFLQNCLEKGGSSIIFLIGGSFGLSDSLKKRANEAICFGEMTFPHQLARVMLLEQIYRAFKINKNEPYHK